MLDILASRGSVTLTLVLVLECTATPVIMPKQFNRARPYDSIITMNLTPNVSTLAVV